MNQQKQILVLARRDHLESMRVAAGLSIFGHEVRLVFMTRPVTEETGTSEQAELLELAGIAPETTVAEMADVLPLLSPRNFAEAVSLAHQVISV